MAHVKNSIRFLVMVTLCSNFAMVFAGDRFDPYSLSSSSASLRSFQLNKIISGIQNLDSAPLFAFLDKSCEKMHHGCALASKIVADNPKEASAVAVTAIVLGLMLYKSEAIKAYFKSKAMEQYKQKIVGTRDSVVKTVDNQIAKVPMPFNMIPLGIRHLIAFVFNRVFAMESEYVAMAVIAPVLGYINSLTPFAALGGLKMGYAVAVCVLTRGWLAIDSEKVIRKMKKGFKKAKNQIAGIESDIQQLGKQLNGQMDGVSNKLANMAFAIDSASKRFDLLEAVVKNTIDIKDKEDAKRFDIVNENFLVLRQDFNTLLSQVEQAAAQEKKDNQALLQSVQKLREDNTVELASLASKMDQRFNDVYGDLISIKINVAEIEKTNKKISELVNTALPKLDNLTQLSVQVQAHIEKTASSKKEADEEIRKQFENLNNKADITNSDIGRLMDVQDKINSKYMGIADTIIMGNLALVELAKKLEIQESGIQVIQQTLEKNQEEYKVFYKQIQENQNNFSKTISEILQKFEQRVLLVEGDIRELKEENASLREQLREMTMHIKQQTAHMENIVAKNESQWKIMQENHQQEREERERLKAALMRQEEKQDSNFAQLNKDLKDTAKGINGSLDDLKNGMGVIVNVAQQLENKNPEYLENGKKKKSTGNQSSSLNATKRKMKFLENTH